MTGERQAIDINRNWTDEGEGGVVLPFVIGAGAVRGQMVRLDGALDRILEGHDYPEPVARCLAETVTLAAALAGALKYDGVFTLQIQAKGAISLVVADVTSEGDLRAYARFDADAVAAAAPGATVPAYFGQGYLAFTVDQGPDTDRYQGIVALEGDTLADCARAYFERSEQLDTALTLALAEPAGESAWQAAAIMIQRMPTGPTSPILTADEASETWNRARIMLESARDHELLDSGLAPARLLHRLYHADRLATYPTRALRARCRCSAARVEGTLRSFPRAEIESMRDPEGMVSVTCEFCKTTYLYGPSELDRLYAADTAT